MKVGFYPFLYSVHRIYALLVRISCMGNRMS